MGLPRSLEDIGHVWPPPTHCQQPPAPQFSWQPKITPQLSKIRPGGGAPFTKNCLPREAWTLKLIFLTSLVTHGVWKPGCGKQDWEISKNHTPQECDTSQSLQSQRLQLSSHSYKQILDGSGKGMETPENRAVLYEAGETEARGEVHGCRNLEFCY